MSAPRELTRTTAHPVVPAAGGLKGALARGQKTKREWTRDGTLVTPEAFAEARGASVQDLLDAEPTGSLFSMVVDDQRYYPAELLKFSSEDAEAVCRALGDEEPSSKLIFLMRKHSMLGGKTVAQFNKRDGLDAVINSAVAWRKRR